MKNSVLSFLKKNIILILLILNTIFILVFSEVKVSSLYNPKKIFLKTKVITKSILVDLGVLNPYTFPFKNSIKYFKKTIEDEKVVIREIIQDSIPSSLNFLNENQNDFVFHVFDGSKTENMIYYNPQNINYPLNLLNLISLLTVHGNKDSQTTFDEKLKIIKQRPLSITCGTNSFFTKELLKSIGVKTRIVSTLTFDEWNGYDNGHTLLEVFTKNLNKWVLYDIDGQKVFKQKNGELLSLIELQQTGVENVEIVSTNNQPFLDYSGFNNYFVLGELVETSPEEWYNRVFQSFSIFDPNQDKFIFLTNTPQESEKINEYFNGSVVTVNFSEFKKRFYP